MKLTPIGKLNSEYRPNNNKLNNNVNFTGFEGILDGCAKFWKVIDSGGRAAQFTVEDMCGTNIPRSYKGLMAGKKYTGKYNFRAFFQEAIREFLTGPTMTIVPIVTLALCKKSFGPSANTTRENLKNLSYLMTGVKEGTEEQVTKEFLTKVARDMLDKTLDGKEDVKTELDADAKQLYEALSSYTTAFKDNLNATKETAKQAKSNLKEQAQNLSNTFSDLIRSRKVDHTTTDFLTAKYSINETSKSGVADIKYYGEYIASYVNDFIKSKPGSNIVDTSKSTIESFRNTAIFKRMIVLFNMIVVTGFLMSFIPKLYTKASGKVNPNASGVYDEAAKRNGKKTTDVKETANA